MATGTVQLPVPAGGFDATNPPGLAFANGRPSMLFDASTDEICYWTFQVPPDFASSPVLKITYGMDTATSGDVVVACEVMCVSDGDSQALDSDSYDTVNTSSATTVPGTAEHIDQISLTLSNADSMAAGDYCALKFRRDADNGSDTATGDLKVWAAEMQYTTT